MSAKSKDQGKNCWGESHNKRRREKYADDEAYRQAQVENTRESYRRNQGIREEDCRVNLSSIDSFGERRRVEWGEETRNMMTFTVSELAAVLGRNPQVVHRWCSKELWPGPVVVPDNETYKMKGGIPLVYTRPEAVLLVTVFGEHQQTSPYLRADHDDTIDKLFDNINVIREGW